MPDERFRAEEIVNKPRQAGVAFGRRSTLAAVCRLQRTTDGKFFRWRKEYGGIWGRPGKGAEGDTGALNRSRPYERLTRPKWPRGVSDEAPDEQEAPPSRGGRGEVEAG